MYDQTKLIVLELPKFTVERLPLAEGGCFYLLKVANQAVGHVNPETQVLEFNSKFEAQYPQLQDYELSWKLSARPPKSGLAIAPS